MRFERCGNHVAFAFGVRADDADIAGVGTGFHAAGADDEFGDERRTLRVNVNGGGAVDFAGDEDRRGFRDDERVFRQKLEIVAAGLAGDECADVDFVADKLAFGASEDGDVVEIRAFREAAGRAKGLQGGHASVCGQFHGLGGFDFAKNVDAARTPVLDEYVDVRIRHLFCVRQLFFQFFGDRAGREATSLDGAAERVAERPVLFDADDFAEFRDAEDLDGKDVARLQGGGFPVIGILGQNETGEENQNKCQVAHNGCS